MKHVFIINSFSLKEKTSEVKSKIEEYCKKNNIDFIIEINSQNYNTEDIAKKYKKTKNTIIAVGGDGVINRILNQIINTENILGFIPYGTGNDFYKTVKNQIKEELSQIDVVKINKKYFINTSCFGIDADVANNKNIVKSKLIPKNQKYNIALIYNFFKYKCRQFEVKINNEVINDKFATIAVCNGSYYGGGYNIAPLSNIKDGYLDVYLAPKMNKISMLRLILKMRKGKHQNSKKISYYKIKKISIKSPYEIKSNIDGEELTAKNFDIEIIKNGITLYYNQELINYLNN